MKVFDYDLNEKKYETLAQGNSYIDVFYKTIIFLKKLVFLLIILMANQIHIYILNLKIMIIHQIQFLIISLLHQY